MTFLARLIKVVLLLAVIGLIGFFTVVAGYADRQRNRVSRAPLPAVDSATRSLHAELNIVDLHADPLLWARDLTQRNTHGHVDVPRLIEGNVAVQLFGVVTQVPPGQNYQSNPADRDRLWMLVAASRWPVETWNNLLQRALYQASRLEQASRDSRGTVVLIRSRQELESFVRIRARDNQRLVGGILAVEGLHALGGNLARLDTLFSAGFRVAGLTHFFDNELGGSSAGLAKTGLSAFGREVVRRMEELGMVVDLAHASPQLIDEVLAVARKPVIVSHTGVQATCPGPRNLSDSAIRRIAANGGVIGIGFWDAAVCDISPAGIAKALRHVVGLVGAQHVALGSDFDGATTTAFDVSQMGQITQALKDARFTQPEIRGIMGENALRVLGSGLP